MSTQKKEDNLDTNNKEKKEDELNLIYGVLSTNKRGFGFLRPFDETTADIYIKEHNLNTAMNGDTIAVEILDRGRDEGRVKKVVKRHVQDIVGTFQAAKRFGFVVPDDARLEDIFIEKKYMAGARAGDKVIVKIVKWAEAGRSPEGQITEILGPSGDKDVELKSLIRKYNLEENYPQAILNQVEKIPTEIEPDEIKKRTDLRSKTVVTIDGADAKDLDDGVSLEVLSNGNYLLGVHIADVAHYVKPDSDLEKEAFKRGTSVYLIDTVIPMLPEKLSNQLCSLNPREDKLTLTCEMEITPKGKVVNHAIFESIISTTERLVYSDVSDLLEAEENSEDPHVLRLNKKYADLLEMLSHMQDLAQVLNENRLERGSINFDFDEAHISLDEFGFPCSISVAERRLANRIIEEFMLLANETVAQHFYWMEVPFLYRVHDKPDPEKIQSFNQFIHLFGYGLRGKPESVHPKSFNTLLKQIEGKPEAYLVSTVMLKVMKKAKYSPDAEGHFGLGVKYYSHFTSPIRRYPDLFIHRIIKASLHGTLDEKDLENYGNIVAQVATHTSEKEQQAEELERELEKVKKTEYMSDHIGEIYEGVVSSVTSFGFFAQLLEMPVEGLIRLDTLPNFYIFEKEKHCLRTENNKHKISIGDPVKIKVVKTNIRNREIDFILL